MKNNDTDFTNAAATVLFATVATTATGPVGNAPGSTATLTPTTNVLVLVVLSPLFVIATAAATTDATAAATTAATAAISGIPLAADDPSVVCS